MQNERMQRASPDDPVDPDLYFDVNGSTPVHEKVLEAAWPFLADAYGNPSAAHPSGLRARAAIDAARETIAAALGARPQEIWFTSGGTESNNWAVSSSVPRSVIGAHGELVPASRAHVVVSAIEHKSVLSAAAELERAGHEVTRIAPDASGAVRVRDVEAAIRPTTRLVSVMVANNETGIVQPAREIGALCRARGIRFHTDAVCAFGKLPVDVRELSCDLLSLAAHKVYAPKGVGVLYVRQGVELPPLIVGCGQQDGMRAGSENAFGVVAFARAVELLQRGALSPERPIESLREDLWRGLQQRFPGCRRNGQGASLPNTLNVCFPGRVGGELQRALGERGISISAGSATATSTPSHVLVAMGLSDADARASVRFSLGRATTPASIRALLAAMEEVCGGSAGSTGHVQGSARGLEHGSMHTSAQGVGNTSAQGSGHTNTQGAEHANAHRTVQTSAPRDGQTNAHRVEHTSAQRAGANHPNGGAR